MFTLRELLMVSPSLVFFGMSLFVPVLAIGAIVHLMRSRQEGVDGFDRIVWALAILMVPVIGPVAYAVFGARALHGGQEPATEPAVMDGA